MAWHALGLLSLLCYRYLPPRSRCSLFCGAGRFDAAGILTPKHPCCHPAAAGEAIPPIACGMHGGTTGRM